MKIHRLILVVLLLALLLAVARTVKLTEAATPALGLSAPASVLTSANSFDVQIVVSNTTNLGAYEMDLQYDSALVQITGVTLSPFLGGGSGCNPAASRCAFALGPRTDTPGTASLGSYTTGSGGGPGGSGVVATIHLHPLGQYGTVSLRVLNALFSDVSGAMTGPVVSGATVILVQPKNLYLPMIRR